MNKKHLPLGVWLKLLGGYSLFIGIIAIILLLGFSLSQQNHHEPQTLTPTPTPKSEKKSCGGIAGVHCPNGYICKLSGKYPDTGGSCVKQAQRN